MLAYPLDRLERLQDEIEERVGHPIGRRISTAMAETESLRWERFEYPRPLFGRTKAALHVVNNDWSLRGLGQISVKGKPKEQVSLIIQRYCASALVAGAAVAVWESIEHRRFRFRWEDDGGSRTLLHLDATSDPVPIPNVTKPIWREMDGPAPEFGHLPEPACQTRGGLQIEGIPSLLLARDTLIRLGELELPHLEDRQRSVDPRTEWGAISETSRLIWWDILAESAAVTTLDFEDSALAATPEHWMMMIDRRLGRLGLTSASNVNPFGQHGGIEVIVNSCFHPALTGGILLGLWDRAEGRMGRCQWSQSEAGHHFIIQPWRDIAE